MRKGFKYVLLTLLIYGFQTGIGISSSFAGEMILIQGGEFIMGSNSGEDYILRFVGGVDEEPRHKVPLKAFYIGGWTVHGIREDGQVEHALQLERRRGAKGSRFSEL